jgi:enoyl-CoA hydratase/carnithine racemase
VIASERAKFGMPEVAFGIPSLTGIIPEVPEMFSGMAYSLIKKGKVFGVHEAKEAGIVKEIVSSDNFQRHALGHARDIESRLFRIIKNGNQSSHNRYILDDLFFKIYDPSCLTMMQLERFRNSI